MLANALHLSWYLHQPLFLQWQHVSEPGMPDRDTSKWRTLNHTRRPQRALARALSPRRARRNRKIIASVVHPSTSKKRFGGQVPRCYVCHDERHLPMQGLRECRRGDNAGAERERERERERESCVVTQSPQGARYNNSGGDWLRKGERRFPIYDSRRGSRRKWLTLG